MDQICIINAHIHNLKNVSCELPRNKLIVITGPSGSGKSSLAFDTIYQEGQRRYIESLSAQAKQFMGPLAPPSVEKITGLSPAIAIEQKTTSRNPRSTVGTVTEIYDFLRILFAKVAVAHCPETGDVVRAMSPEEMTEQILSLSPSSKTVLMAPIVVSQKGEHKELLGKFAAMGLSRIRVNGDYQIFPDTYSVKKTQYNKIELVVDRFLIKDSARSRIEESLRLALQWGNGAVILDNEKNKDDLYFSQSYYSPKIKKSYPELTSRHFSFNSPLGACDHCSGLGELKYFGREGLLRDESSALFEGAIPLIEGGKDFLAQVLKGIAKSEKINLDVSFAELPESFQKILFEGSKSSYSFVVETSSSRFRYKKAFPGLSSWFEKRYSETHSERLRKRLEEFMEILPCSICKGQRLKAYSLAATIQGKNISEFCQLPLEESLDFLESIENELSGTKKIIAEKLLIEIKGRLQFLIQVGLSYLSLDRSAQGLSGGESQRIRLATQLGSGLSGVLYVLDEPSIGLHQRDNHKLLKTLRSLGELGNTVLVVEHDEETMRAADYLIDMGPGAGDLGGEILAEGEIKLLLAEGTGPTLDYLRQKKTLPLPEQRRSPGPFLTLRGASIFNIEDLTIKIPLECLCCLTGVSGSGKSSLVRRVLIPALKNHFDKRNPRPTNFKSLKGVQHLNGLIELDQAPIGRTPKSNPGTYTGLFNHIRLLFSRLPEAQIKGLLPGSFSFNVKDAGRCEHCEGNGQLKMEMHFLPDVYIRCPKCHGTRFQDAIKAIRYRGKSIADVLEMSVSSALVFFNNHPPIARALRVMENIGLGYMKLGQPAPTLSGGEAQRLKLCRELSKKTKDRYLYILDEPTTGLHFHDIGNLLRAIEKLITDGHSVLLIEHNLDMIKVSDWVIDLGPEGGSGGGKLVAEGTPEQVAEFPSSHTGRYLKKLLS